MRKLHGEARVEDLSSQGRKLLILKSGTGEQVAMELTEEDADALAARLAPAAVAERSPRTEARVGRRVTK